MTRVLANASNKTATAERSTKDVHVASVKRRNRCFAHVDLSKQEIYGDTTRLTTEIESLRI
jgi:hypothetical protein